MATGEVVINEIAWMGRTSISDEWIELKNLNNQDIDLTGWSLNYGTSSETITTFINLTGKIIGDSYFLLEKNNSKGYINEDSLKYAGKALNNNGAFLELMDSEDNIIDSIDFFDDWSYNGKKAGNSVSKKTAERCGNSWQTSASAGGTPKAENECFPEEETENDEENKDENEKEDEEIGEEDKNEKNYNYGDVVINEFLSDPEEGGNEWVELYDSTGETNLNNWYLSDGSGAKTVLSGKFSNRFFLLEKPKGALNNSGDEISLFSPADKLIDRAVYGSWENSAEENIPVLTKGISAARIEDGQQKESLIKSFKLTSNPTPGEANIITEISSTTEKENIQTNTIRITEIFPNPGGSDREQEFIEFKNNSDETISLTGWKITIENGRTFIFGEFFSSTATITPNGYFALFRKESNLVLDNGGGTIKLFKPDSSRAYQVLEYKEAPENACFADSSEISDNASEETKNFLLNSLTPGGWVWTYRPTPGKTNEILSLNRPPQPKFFLPEKISTGTPLIFDASDSIDEDGDPLYFSWDFGDGIKISGETVSHTFLRTGDYDVCLSISDGQTESVFLKTISFLPPSRTKTSEKSTSVSIEKNKNAANSTPITLNENLSAALSGGEEEFFHTPIKEINNKTAGDNVSVAGTVIVPPKIYGTQYFYIISSTDEKTPFSLKIYNFKKDFPELKINDSVVIKGQVMKNAEEKYLKISNKESIEIFGSAELPEPEEVEILSSDDLNKFLSVRGEIAKKDGNRIFLETSAGKVSVYLKSGTEINKSELKSGMIVKITGLAGIVSQETELLPRGQDDIEILSGTGETETNEGTGKSDSLTSTSSWVLPENLNKNNTFIYFLITISFVAAVAGLILKRKFRK